MITGCAATPSVLETYPGMRFSIVIARNIVASDLHTAVAAFAGDIYHRLQLGDIDNAAQLEQFTAFFTRHHHPFPLAKQIRAATRKGFPPVPAPVLGLLALEAATGTLMGVQDGDAICGEATLAVACAGEQFTGMGGKAIRCAAGELIVRDDEGIVASVFQGPDARTAIHSGSSNLAFYVFDTSPSIGPAHAAAVETTATLLREAAQVEILTPPAGQD